MNTPKFLIVSLIVATAIFLALRLFDVEYLFVAGYIVVQYVILATAWNILGGYTGYVNFGSAAFFAVGAYSSVALITFATRIEDIFPENVAAALNTVFPLPIPVLILVAGVVAGAVGFGMGYLTLRLRGAFFAIATLALAVVLQTLVVNWDFVGGSSGAYVIAPAEMPGVRQLQAVSVRVDAGDSPLSALRWRAPSNDRGSAIGFAAIRDDELAAEASGVPTLRLKLIATTLSGALMGMAGAPFPYYIGFLQPSSAFGLEYAVNSIAMPMIGGTMNWIGPLVGAVLLGTLQQVANVTISSAVNLLIVGLLLIFFVIVAPNGLVGLVQDWKRARRPK